MSSAAIKLEGVSVTLGRQEVLSGVDLTITPGEIVALIGPNGGGKTTLLRVLLGLLEPQRGLVRVLGGTAAAARGRVGYVPQYTDFDAGFPILVHQVVGMGDAATRRRSRRDRKASTDAALERLGITDLRDRSIGKLSGGQLQSVLIARALALEPELLILDEPTASLDVRSAGGFYDLLKELATRMTVIISSHDVGEVSAHVDSIACLNRELFYHRAEDVTADLLANLYGYPVKSVVHGPAGHGHGLAHVTPRTRR